METKTLRRPERLRHVPRLFSGPLLRRDLPCDDGGAELIYCQTYCQSRLLPQQRGLSSNQIASELGIRPQTAAKYANLATFARRRGIKPASKLDLFKPAITRSPEHHPYRATRTAPPGSISACAARRATPAASASGRPGCGPYARCEP